MRDKDRDKENRIEHYFFTSPILESGRSPYLYRESVRVYVRKRERRDRKRYVFAIIVFAISFCPVSRLQFSGFN